LPSAVAPNDVDVEIADRIDLELALGQGVAEAIHAVGLPKGVINILNGYGSVAGAVLSTHPDIAKVSCRLAHNKVRDPHRGCGDLQTRDARTWRGKGPQTLLDVM
jgi:aldehyde dehydrogenase (NAD+)